MPNQYRVLITDRAWPDSELEREILGSIGADVVEATNQDETSLARQVQDVDAIAVCWAPLSGKTIRQARRCRVICRMGIGLDNIDVATATELKIPVTNVPDYCVPEVSNHALGLLLASARNLAFFHAKTKQGEYDLAAAPPMHRLQGRVLGLVGLGRIAQALVPKAQSLGLKVIAHTPSANDYGTGCEMVSFDELLRSSDFVSLHLPLTEQSHHLFCVEEFAAMKENAVLINTSRGPLVNHDALWHALQENQIGGAALDVFDPEPPDLSQPLFRDARVIVTPHAAFYSVEAVRELRSRVAHQIVAVLTGETPENVVNPEVLA